MRLQRWALPVLGAAALAVCTATAASASTSDGWPANWTLPNHGLTPGATATGYGIKNICPYVNPKLEAARPSYAEEQQVYARYGITSHRAGQYEVDHLIPIELLGSPSSIQNLWPEPNDKASSSAIKAEGLDPAYILNSKDILEDVLHKDVCDGQVSLAMAQHAIATDWRVAYVKYVGSAPMAGTPAPARAWCTAKAGSANDGYSGDRDVYVLSNQVGRDATASDAGDTWSHYTSSSGSTTIRLWNQYSGELIKVTVGGATCWTRA
jgi:hypothetical protein